jgi:hypothetical protein
MKPAWGAWAAVVLLAMGAPAAGAAPAQRLKVKTVTLRMYHRVFHEFRDEARVGLRQDFPVGDTDYSARVVEFVPDFALDLEKHKVISRSSEPRNPAFHIVVRKQGVPQDTTWAFLNMPPHFARKSLIAFQVMRIDFENHAPVLADTAWAKPPGATPEVKK